MRIVKAQRAGHYNKVKSLQWLLTHSFYAKAMAVKRVTSNQGKKTPGVDHELWLTPQAKLNAVDRLKRRGYQPSPLRRIYIPKKNGKMRPLSIPTMKDRAMQTLYNYALQPIAETTADPNSYGFRIGRGTHDAIEQCFTDLNKGKSPVWILICTQFSGHRVKIESLGFYHGCFPELRGRHPFCFSLDSAVIIIVNILGNGL